MVLDFGPWALIGVHARSLTTALSLVQVWQLVFVNLVGKNRVRRASTEMNLGRRLIGYTLHQLVLPNGLEEHGRVDNEYLVD